MKKGLSLVLNVVSFEAHPSGFHLWAISDQDQEMGRNKDAGEEAMELKDKAVLNKLFKVQRIVSLGLAWWTKWMGIYLPVCETQVQCLLQEESACCGATKPVHHSS